MRFTYHRMGSLLALLGLFNLAACSEGNDALLPSQQDAVQITAEVLKLNPSDVSIHYTSSGTVTSDHRVAISSRISGYIRELSVREGDAVKAGQVLVRVDPVDAKQALIQVEADLSDAELDLQRYEGLFKAGAVTQQQLDKVRLRSQVIHSQLKQARNQLSYAAVISPVSGVVVEKKLSQGDLASPGLTILTIEDPDSLLVETFVSEQFVSRIREGASADIVIPSLAKHFQGNVRQLVEAADPVSHQFLVKIALPVSSAVHPGMYAEVGFKMGQRQAILIPMEAVVSRSGLHAVYVLDDQSVAHYRQIRLGLEQNEGTVEVLSGLKDGDVIIWHASVDLKSGMKVLLAKSGA